MKREHLLRLMLSKEYSHFTEHTEERTISYFRCLLAVWNVLFLGYC